MEECDRSRLSDGGVGESVCPSSFRFLLRSADSFCLRAFRFAVSDLG